MAQRRRNNNNSTPSNGINWLALFQSINSKYGRLTLFTGILSLGYGAGFFSEKVIKDREMLIKEREYNDLKYELNAQKIQFERERSDSKLEINQIKIILINTRDSLKNGRKE